MSMIWTSAGPYRRAGFKKEAELEAAIWGVRDQLFGNNRIYLPVKKKIGSKGGPRNS